MGERATPAERRAWYSEAKDMDSYTALEQFEDMRDYLRPELRRCRGRRHYPALGGARLVHRRGRLRHDDPMCAEEAVLAVESLLEDARARSLDDDSTYDAGERAAEQELGARAIATLRAVLGMPNRPAGDLDPLEQSAEYQRMIFEEYERRGRPRRRSRAGSGPDAEKIERGDGPAIGAPIGDPVGATAQEDGR